MGFCECNRVMRWKLEKDRMEAFRRRRDRTAMQTFQQRHSIIG